jgi:transglutaminase-like putative cysteine protease
MYLKQPTGGGLGLTSQLYAIPEGAAGVRQTLYLMRALTQQYKTALPLRTLAAQLVQDCTQKNWACEVKQLHAFVRDRIRYVRDIHGVETVQSPDKTLELGYGDCDDKATLLATLLQTIGHPVRFVAIGTRTVGDYSHVFVETQIGPNGKTGLPRWIALETTEPVPAGWSPPKQISRMVVKV